MSQRAFWTISPKSTLNCSMQSGLTLLRGIAKHSILALVVAGLWSGRSDAQLSGKGTISGTVTDATGAAVSGASVTAINIATDVKTTRTTTSSGYYVLSPMDPGTYTVSVEAKWIQDADPGQGRCGCFAGRRAGSQPGDRYRFGERGGDHGSNSHSIPATLRWATPSRIRNTPHCLSR